MTDATGRIIADNYDYTTAQTWLASHTISQLEMRGIDEAAASEILATIEREIIQADTMGSSVPSVLAYEHAIYGGWHQFSEGFYEVTPGVLDLDPVTPATMLVLVDSDNDSAAGYELTALDNAFQDYTANNVVNYYYTFPTYNFDSWDYGDDWGPVVLDLDGTSIDLVPRTSSTVYFDHDGDGWIERTAWAGPQDGMLVLDLDPSALVIQNGLLIADENGELPAAAYAGDGVITSRYEVSFYNRTSTSDLTALDAIFDSNHNHQLDAGDAHWSSFKVWRDTNQDGKTDAGELVTLASLGITSVALISDQQGMLLPDGTRIYGYSSYTYSAGGVSNTRSVADTAFSYNVSGFLKTTDPGYGFIYYGEDGSILPINTNAARGWQNTPVNWDILDNVAGVIGGNLADTLNVSGSAAKTLYGGAGNDVIAGGAGNDEIDGGTGIDALNGGGGDDTIYFEAGDNILGGTGYDTGIAVSQTALSLDLAVMQLEALIANWGSDIITAANVATAATIDGRGGNDTITGGSAGDMLTGGAGNDTINAGAGGDLILGGAGGDTLDGQDGDDVVFGGDGNDTLNGGIGSDKLDGGAGADAMSGGSGDDTYIVDNASDAVTEAAGSGTDGVETTLVAYTLGNNVEKLTYTGSAGAFTGTGNSLANVITGGGGSDALDGGSGNDTLAGGAGSDLYYVQDAGDTIVENAGEGADSVIAYVTYTLPANVEAIYTLAGGGATGNGLDNLLNGSYASAGQSLDGGDGNDTIYGTTLADQLTGGSGSDALYGLGGNDTMTGGAGDDAYFVSTSGTTVTETAGNGTDTIYATVNVTLPANVEILVPYGGATSGTGNGADNVLIGSSSGVALTLDGAGGNDTVYGSNFADTLIGGTGNDLLQGYLGNDTMQGGAGDDVYIVEQAGDVVTESAGGGTDTVYASVSYTLAANVETLFINGGATSGTGNAGDNSIINYGIATGVTLDGAAGNDVVQGGAGNDTIIGGAGADTLTGLGGNDTFTFNVGEAGGDTITDFAGNGAAAGDQIRLLGYGAGATFTQVDATHWQVNYGPSLATHEIITFANGASVHASDVLFV